MKLRQIRLTTLRAKKGFCGEVSHLAKYTRVSPGVLSGSALASRGLGGRTIMKRSSVNSPVGAE